MPFSTSAVVLAATIAVGASAVAVPAASADSSRAEAERAALTALRARSGTKPLIVFRGGLLRPGTRIAAAGQLRLAAPRASSAGARDRERLLRAAEVQVVRAPPVATVGRERTWFFYADEAPFQAYQHPGRVVLVGARSGRVTVSGTLHWPPLLNGRLPYFLRSYAGYRNPRVRLFERLWRADRATAGTADPLAPARDPLPAAGARAAAAQLAAERSCVVRVGDTLGNFYDASAFDQTRAGVGALFNQLARLDGGFVSVRYRVASGSSLRRYVARLVAERGCRDVLLYLAGGGYVHGGEPAISVGIQGRADGRLEQQAITATLLRAIVADHPQVTFKLQLDAPGSGALERRLEGLPNLVLFLASSRSGRGSFTALPDLPTAGGGTLRNGYNADGLLEFSNRGLHGLRCFLADPAEVAAAAADKAAGRSRSFLAAMLWRAYQLCGEGSLLDVVAPGSAAPVARLLTPAPQPPAPTPPTPQPPVPPAPRNGAPTAAPVAVETDEDAPVSFTLAGADPDGDQLTYALVAQPPNGTVSGGDGAARTFTPDRDWHGTTSFDYTVSDGRGGSATGTVTITVAPVADPPVVTVDSAPQTWDEGAGAVPVAGDATVTAVDTPTIRSATIAISGGFQAHADRIVVDDDGIVDRSYDAATGVMTLTGDGSAATYEALLENARFTNDSNRPSPAPRTITFTVLDANGVSSAPVSRTLNVVPHNAAPTLGGIPSTVAFTEGDGPTALAPSATVTDPDDPTFGDGGVTVAIGSGFEPGADVLTVSTGGGVRGSYDAAAGVLRLTGDALPVAYATVLRSLRYVNDSDDPSPAERTVTITVDDGSGGTASATVRLTVTPADDPPVLTASGGATAFSGSAVAVDPGLTVNDADDAQLTSATVTIAAGFTAGDVLAVTSAHGVSATYDAGGGVLTLTGAASLADYQSLLRQVTFSRASFVGGTRTIAFDVANGAASNSATKTVTLSSAPVVTLPSGALAYREGDGARAIDPAATVSDGDSTALVSGTVTITSGFQVGDTLAADTTGTPITAFYDPTSHALLMSGAATVGDWQRVLRAVRFRNDSATISTAPRTIAFAVSDGTLQSSEATTTVTVTAVDSPPVVTTSGGTAAYTEGDAAVVVDGGLTVTDGDSPTLTGATVALSTVFAGDELLFTDQNGIAGSYDAASGRLTLSGDATVAAYQAALRSVRFRTVGDDPVTTTRRIAFAAADATSSGAAADADVTVTAVNDAPTVTSGATLAYRENDPATAIDPALTVGDPDDARLAGATVRFDSGFVAAEDMLLFVNAAGITGSYNAGTGVLTLTGDATVAAYEAALRSVTYRNGSENPSTADRAIRFTVTDGDLSASATATVTVTAVDDAPSAPAVAADTVGNTRLAYGTGRPSGRAARVVSGRSLLDGVSDVDTPGPFAAVAETVASAAGGSATIAADGTFDYTPAAGFVGSDSFTAGVVATSAAGVVGSVTVNVTVGSRVWYVDNRAAAGGSGRSHDPFDTLAGAVAASAAGDTIYLFAGDGAATGTGAPVALKAGQRLLGERAPLVVGGTTLYDGDAAKRPQVAGPVTQSDGGVVRGLRLLGGISASGAAGGTLDDLVIAATGGDALQLSGVSGSWRLSDLDVTNSGGDGIAIVNSAGATVDFVAASTIAVVSGNGSALELSGATTAGQIDSLSTGGTGGAAAAVSITRTSGALTLDDLNLRTVGTGGVGLLLDDSAGVVVNGSGDASIDAGGQAVALRTSTTAPAAKVQPRVTLTSVRSAGGPYGVELDDVGDATFSAAGGALSGQTTAAFSIGGGSGDVTYGGTIADGSGDSVAISGRAGGTVGFGGTITDGGDDGGGIVVTGSGGGAVAFTAPGTTLSTGTRRAVDLSFSGPASVAFSGGSLSATTTSGDAFSARTSTANGTVSVTGAGNVARSTTGAALRVDGPDIAAAGLRFRSLTSAGAVSGLVLRDTGSAGGLTVSGDGTLGSGGTITSSTGAGIDLRNATGIALTDLFVTGGADDGIRAQGVDGMALTRVTLTGNGDAAGESNIDMAEPRGAIVLDGVNASGAGYRGLAVATSAGATTIDVDGGSWGGSSGAAADDTINVDASGSANLAVTVDGITSTGAAGDHVQVTSAANAQSTITAVVRASSFENTPGGPGGGLTFNPGGSARLRATVSGNAISGAALEALTIASPGSDASPQPVTIDATIANNAIGRAAVASSGAFNGNGIGLRATGGATVRAAISGNQIRQYTNAAGIRLAQSDGGGSLDATVTGNMLAQPSGPGALYGLYATAGSGGGADNGQVCLDLRGNTMTGSGQTGLGGFDVSVRRRDLTTMRLPGYGGGATDDAAVAAFLSGNNPSSPTASAASNGGSFSGGGSSCAAPQ